MTSPIQKLTLTLSIAGLVLLATPATAQKDSLIAPDPVFVVHIDGPQKLATALRPTNVGKMCSGKEFNDLISPLMKMIEQMQKQAGDEVPFDLEALKEAAINYGGRVTVAMHIVNEVDFRSSEPPFGFTFLMSPDAKTDLKAMCAKIGKLAEEAGDKLSDLEVEGKTFRVVSDDGEVEEDSWAASLPFMHKGHAVCCISSHLKRSLAMILNPEQKPRHKPSASLRTASFGIQVDAQKLVSMIEEGMKGQKGDDYKGSEAQILIDNTGIKSLEGLEISYRAKGPYIASDSIIQFNDKDRGLLACLFPKTRKPNPLLACMPRTTSLATTFHFNPVTLFEGIKKIWGLMEDADVFLPISWEKIEGGFEDEMGFRLKEDFLAHIGSYHLLAQQISSDDEEDDPLEDPDGTCLAMQLKNAEAFGKNLEKMLRSQGLHAARKSEDYKGQKVHRVQLMGIAEVHYAVADRMLLLGFGNKGGDVVRSVLNAEADHKAGKEPAKLSSGLSARLKSVQPGYVDLGWVNVNANLKAITRAEEQLDMLLDLPEELGVAFKMIEKIRPILKNYKVDEQLSVIRTEGNRIIYRTLW